MIDIIPAIDLIEGKCVRLTKGDYQQKKVYNENPVEVAKKFEDNGINRLHLVDLDGAKAKHVVNWKVLESIASKTNLIIDFGGGVKSDDDLNIVFSSGAEMVTAGSISIKDPELVKTWATKYGAEKIILGADVQDEKIAISGWQDITDINLYDYLKDKLTLGLKKIICTDISKDGMLQGTSVDLYKKILSKFPDIYLIASGGVTHIDEIHQLNEINCGGVIIGKAIYEGKISLSQLKELL